MQQYHLELLKLLFKTTTKVTLVGDPRQVTYLTHNEAKHNQYSDGKIKQFLEEKCKSLINGNIDETSLSVSHRNNQEICNYSSKLYPTLPATNQCVCEKCRSITINHTGIYLVNQSDLEKYLERFKPVQLRWDKETKGVNPNFKAYNFGESKGKTFQRVLIYPTSKMKQWVIDNNYDLKNGARAKFYVALTRARYSAGIVWDNTVNTIEGTKIWNENE